MIQFIQFLLLHLVLVILAYGVGKMVITYRTKKMKPGEGPLLKRWENWAIWVGLIAMWYWISKLFRSAKHPYVVKLREKLHLD